VKRKLSLALLAILLAVAGLVSYRSVLRVRELRRAQATCAAADRGDWKGALASSRREWASSVAYTQAALRAADCRCVALVATGRRDECSASLERLLADPRTDEWLPRPPLVALLVDSRQRQGKLEAALELASRGLDRTPRDPTLLVLEASLHLQLEPAGHALDRTTERLRTTGADARARILLGRLASAHDQWEAVLTLLGESPPSGPDAETWANAWFQHRAEALGHLGRLPSLVRLVDEWEKRNARFAHAIYGLTLSVTQQLDPRGRSIIDLLHEGIAAPSAVDDPQLLKAMYFRYVAHLAIAGRQREALAALEEGVARVGDIGLDAAEVRRTMNVDATPAPTALSAGAVILQVSSPAPGMHLLVSPPPAANPDEPYSVQPVPPSGRVVVRSASDTWPLRWVLRDADGGVRGAGASWSAAAGTDSTTIPVAQGPATRPLASSSLDQRAADGRSRLFVIILDCGDWRFVEDGIARGELPTFAALIARGTHGVLWSEPAFTAIAVRSIAQPGAKGVDGVFGVLHELGEEVAGLNFVGENPVAALSAILPTTGDLFATLGTGGLSAANLLHSYGGMQVGRHGEVVGPHGARSSVPLVPSRRLRPDEEAPFGRLAEDRPQAEEMAADFDNAVGLARAGGPDLVVLRVASLDILTHGNFHDAFAADRDGTRPLLPGAYRYIDRRLAEVYRALDGDDVLVVMSDHGIRTALQHDPRAMFIAVGGAVAPGRLPGLPELRGIPRMIADFFGIATPWPSTGVEAWLPGRAAPAGSAEAAALTGAGGLRQARPPARP
jgi:tetratricopeptide (TPR) repeat protein